MAAIAISALIGCGSGKEKDKPAAAPAPSAETKAPATTTASSAPAALNACEVVTKEDAESVAGTPVPPATPLRDTCTYSAPPTGPTAQVEVYIGDGAKKILDIDKGPLGHEFKTVSGIGDEGYSEENGIFFRKGSTWVAIRLVRLNDPAENTGPLEALARTAVARV